MTVQTSSAKADLKSFEGTYSLVPQNQDHLPESQKSKCGHYFKIQVSGDTFTVSDSIFQGHDTNGRKMYVFLSQYRGRVGSKSPLIYDHFSSKHTSSTKLENNALKTSVATFDAYSLNPFVVYSAWGEIKATLNLLDDGQTLKTHIFSQNKTKIRFGGGPGLHYNNHCLYKREI